MEQIKLVEPAVILAFLSFANKHSLIKACLSLPMIFRKSSGSSAERAVPSSGTDPSGSTGGHSLVRNITERWMVGLDDLRRAFQPWWCYDKHNDELLSLFSSNEFEILSSLFKENR